MGDYLPRGCSPEADTQFQTSISRLRSTCPNHCINDSPVFVQECGVILADLSRQWIFHVKSMDTALVFYLSSAALDQASTSARGTMQERQLSVRHHRLFPNA